jgi:Fic-DOC domain mobile mystery protein B
MKIIFGDLVPGETPLDDVSELKVPGITTRKELSVIEAANIRKVLVKYFADPPTPDLAPFDFEWVRGLHREMFGDVWEWAGQFRTRNLNIGCSWTQVQENLYNLLENLGIWKASGMNLVEQASRLHHRAVEIHPFVNGNGRWGRMLTNIWLTLHGNSYVAWPEDVIGTESTLRGAYIRALQAADAGDIDLLLEMHRSHLATN